MQVFVTEYQGFSNPDRPQIFRTCFDLGIADSLAAVISPHLDDAVLGCAGFLQAHRGAFAVTVMAGRPAPGRLTDWDGKCGFHEGDDVVGARRREDEKALKMLGARPVWLDFLDHQYAPEAPIAEVAAALAHACKDFEIVAIPLGLGHGDHLVTAAACREVARLQPKKRWFVYEDVIYRRTVGGTDAALAGLRAAGFALEPADFPVDMEAKRRAIDAYASQLTGLGDLIDDAYSPERYWTMMRT